MPSSCSSLLPAIPPDDVDYFYAPTPNIHHFTQAEGQEICENGRLCTVRNTVKSQLLDDRIEDWAIFIPLGGASLFLAVKRQVAG